MGITPVLAATGVDEQKWFDDFFARSPYHGENPQPPNKYTPLALQLFELVRSEIDEQPEGVIVGAAGLINWITLYSPPGSDAHQALWAAGFLECMQSTMRRYNPMERISRHIQIPGAVLGMCKDIVEGAHAAGIEVIQPLIDAGAVDIAISSLQAYQIMDTPSECSVNSLQWGGLWFLEVLLESRHAAQPVIAKLRSAGVDAFRYMLDHPLIMMADMGYETGSIATRIAAIVWGRDDDGGGLAFKQKDVDKIIQVMDPRGSHFILFPMTEQTGRVVLNLSVSEINKELLLNAEGLVPLLVSSLLLDLEDPRRSQPNFEAIAPVVQRDVAEAIAQLAMFPPGRTALLQDPTVVEALQQVAAEGWEDEARNHAQSALAALTDRQHVEHRQHSDVKHVMVSYNWSAQEVVTRIVRELQARGFRTWFDLDK